MNTPRIDREKVRNYSVTVRLSKEEKSQLQNIADKQGVSKSTYARMVLLKSFED